GDHPAVTARGRWRIAAGPRCTSASRCVAKSRGAGFIHSRPAPKVVTDGEGARRGPLRMSQSGVNDCRAWVLSVALALSCAGGETPRPKGGPPPAPPVTLAPPPRAGTPIAPASLPPLPPPHPGTATPTTPNPAPPALLAPNPFSRRATPGPGSRSSAAGPRPGVLRRPVEPPTSPAPPQALPPPQGMLRLPMGP